MAETQAQKELAEYKAGTITLDQLAQIWAARSWDTPDIEHGFDAVGELGGPGTWDEVLSFMLTGQLSDAEYQVISEKSWDVNEPGWRENRAST
jgi:hypothetical protein